MTEIVERPTERDAQTDAPATPYVGLVPYGEADAPFFFGRDDDRAIVTANLRAARLTILYGPSGVGKSSLLLAGVVHQLRVLVTESAATRPERAPSAVCVFRSWRGEPLSALMESIRAAAMEALGGRELQPWRDGDSLAETLRQWNRSVRTLLVILDQFEDYFLYHPDDDGEGTLAAELPRIVNDPTLRVNVLVSIREDAWAKLDRFEGRIPHLFANYVRVEHLSVQAARQAIEEPLEEWNRRLPPGDEPYEIESELVGAVLEQVRAGRVVMEQGGRGKVEDAGSDDGEERVETAYLQLVMTRLWDEEKGRASRVLRLKTLEDLGGAQTIVRTHLDDALGGLSADEQDLIADLFNHLVTPSGTKIAHTTSDLAAYTGRPVETIEPVLETLSAGQTRILRPVSTGDGPTRYEIFHDVLAAAVLDWRARRVQGRLERERAAAEEQVRHERRRARTFRALAVVSTALMVFAGVLAVVFLKYSQRQANSDSSRELAGSARDRLDNRLDLAIPLALAAYHRSHTVEARSALLATEQRATRLVRMLRPDGNHALLGAAFDPVRARLVTAGDRGLVIWDRTGNRIAQRGTSQVTSVAFSPRGDVLAASDKRGVTLWGTRRWDRRMTIRSGAGAAPVTISADGSRLAILNTVGLMSIWRIDRRQPVQTPTPAVVGDVQNIAFSPANPTLLAVVSGLDRRLSLWGLRRGRALFVGPAEINALAFSRDGKRLALAQGGRIQIWSVADRASLASIRSGETRIVGLAFSGDGKTLASSAEDRSVRLWNIDHPTAVRQIGGALRGRAEEISGMAFGGSNVLAVTSRDGTVTIWNTRRDRGLFTTTYSKQVPRDSVMSPDGRFIASIDEPIAAEPAAAGPEVLPLQSPANSRVEPPTAEIAATTPVAIWTVGSTTRHLVADGISVPLRFAPGDTKLLMLTTTKSGDHPGVWNLSTPKPIALRGVLPIGAHVDVARDGSVAIAADSAITFWGATRNRPIRTSTPSAVQALAVSADATRVALGYQGGGLAIWRPGVDTAPRVIATQRSPVTLLAFSQDSRLLAAAAGDTIALVDVEGGREIGTLSGNWVSVNAISFSADDQLLASGDGKTIRLWDVKTRRPLGETISMPADVSAVAFGPHRLVARTSDGTVRTWDKGLWFVDSTSWPSLRDRLCGLVERIDENEWKSVLAGASSQQPCKARGSGRPG